MKQYNVYFWNGTIWRFLQTINARRRAKALRQMERLHPKKELRADLCRVTQ